MRKDALFIGVEVDDAVAGDPELAVKLDDACPVDIYKASSNGVEIVESNLDECVLCGLCLAAAPAGTIKVLKLYDDEAVLQPAA